MSREPIAISENVKFVSTILMIYLFLSSFPINIFIFGTGLLVGMWVSNKYDTVPILDYLQVDYHIKLSYNFMGSLYKKYSNFSEGFKDGFKGPQSPQSLHTSAQSATDLKI